MHLERLLQISIATLTVLGPFLLGAGDRFPTMPLWVLLAAVTSLWVTDTQGWLRLNRTVTNLAAAGALLLSIGELSQFRGGIDILAITRLLAYLQIILLFQEKDFRTYWQLAALSLLQVIVAAAFNQGSSFGLLLVAYLFVGIVSLAVFHLHRDEVLAASEAERTKPTGRFSRPAGNAAGQAENQRHASPPASRWPWIDLPPEFATSHRASAGGLVREFWLRLAKMTLGSLLLAVVIFSAVPRLGSGAWYGTSMSLQRMVGFSDVVNLGALGTVIQNPQEVLLAEFHQQDSERPYQVIGGVYFHGALLTDYSSGHWDSRGQLRFRGATADLDPIGPAAGDELVVQEITIQPMDREELFCVWPFVGVEQDARLQIDASRRRLTRPGRARSRFTYRLGTTAFENNVQRQLVPADDPFGPQGLLRVPRGSGEMGVPELVRLADRWIEESELPEENRYRRALWLEHMLRDSGDFEYSLEGQPRRLDIDPIDDFVKNNRRGHCEYFATALALMLRSQGIPARVVVGFKTNEWNDLGEFYQVRQLHAHTWVEAYLEPEHIPPEMLHADRPWQWLRGAWMRLDPTPAARDLGLESGTSFFGRLDSYLNWLDYVWTSYVMDMDQPRQQETIYNPVITAIRSLWGNLTSAQWWAETFGKLGGAAREAFIWLLTGRWLNWSGLMWVTALVAVLALAYAGVRRAWRRPGEDPLGHRTVRRRVQVEFYRQLETVLAHFGLRRRATQTQREFALSAAATIFQNTGADDLAALPVEIVEAFYRVRFGGASLDKDQIEAVERALADLARATVY